jgi:hypothetical protein
LGMNKPVFTEDMTPEEFKAKNLEMESWPPEARDKAIRNFISVLERKILSGEWEIVDL